EILALEEPDEGCRRALEAVDHILAVFDPPFFKPARHVAKEFALLGGKIADDEAAHRQPFAQYAPHQRRNPVGAGWQLGRAVLRDEATHRYPGERIEQRQHRIEYGAADVLEVDIDALWTSCLETLGKI